MNNLKAIATNESQIYHRPPLESFKHRLLRRQDVPLLSIAVLVESIDPFPSHKDPDSLSQLQHSLYLANVIYLFI